MEGGEGGEGRGADGSLILCLRQRKAASGEATGDPRKDAGLSNKGGISFAPPSHPHVLPLNPNP